MHWIDNNDVHPPFQKRKFSLYKKILLAQQNQILFPTYYLTSIQFLVIALFLVKCTIIKNY